MRLTRRWHMPRGPLARMAHMTATFTVSDLLKGALRMTTAVVVARRLGRDAFGRWTLYMACASVLTIAFDCGFGVLLTREAAAGDDRVAPLVPAAMRVRLVLLLPIAACLVAGPLAIRLFGSRRTAAAVVSIAAAGLLYGVRSASFRTGPARLLVAAAIETGGAAALGAGSLAIVFAGGGVDPLLYLAAAILLAELVAASALWRRISAGTPSPARPPIGNDWAVLRRGLPFAASGLIANLQGRLTPLMLGALSDPTDLAAFDIAARLETTARRLPHAALGAALPMFASPAERSELIRSRLEAALGWLAAAAGLLLVGAAPALVRLTYGDRFMAAVTPLRWAAAALVPSIVNASRKVYLNATGREQRALVWSATALVVQAAAAVVLIPRAGATGAVWAIGIGELATLVPLRMAVDGRRTGDGPANPRRAPAAIVARVAR